MLHYKLHFNPPTASGEDVLRVFTIYGHESHLGYHVTYTICINFHSCAPISFQMVFSLNNPIVYEKNKT